MREPMRRRKAARLTRRVEVREGRPELTDSDSPGELCLAYRLAQVRVWNPAPSANRPATRAGARE
jgi:hypothetical protein